MGVLLDYLLAQSVNVNFGEFDVQMGAKPYFEELI